MSLINSLGKHPASNTSCLDGEAVTSLAAPSPAFFSPRPPGARRGRARACPAAGVRGQGGQSLGTTSPKVLHCHRWLREGWGLTVLCTGSPGGEVLCSGCISLETAHTTAVSIPTQRQALPSCISMGRLSPVSLVPCLGAMGHAEMQEVSAEPSKRPLVQGEITEEHVSSMVPWPKLFLFFSC